MRQVDNECVGCTGMGLPCMHCGKKHISHYTCDGHGCDADTIDGVTKLYEDGDKHYCLKCLIENYKNDFIEYMTTLYGEEWATECFEVVT